MPLAETPRQPIRVSINNVPTHAHTRTMAKIPTTTTAKLTTLAPTKTKVPTSHNTTMNSMPTQSATSVEETATPNSCNRDEKDQAVPDTQIQIKEVRLVNNAPNGADLWWRASSEFRTKDDDEDGKSFVPV